MVSVPVKHWPTVLVPHPVPAWLAGVAQPVGPLMADYVSQNSQALSSGETDLVASEAVVQRKSAVGALAPVEMLRRRSHPDDELESDALELRALALRPPQPRLP